MSYNSKSLALLEYQRAEIVKSLRKCDKDDSSSLLRKKRRYSIAAPNLARFSNYEPPHPQSTKAELSRSKVKIFLSDDFELGKFEESLMNGVAEMPQPSLPVPALPKLIKLAVKHELSPKVEKPEPVAAEPYKVEEPQLEEQPSLPLHFEPFSLPQKLRPLKSDLLRTPEESPRSKISESRSSTPQEAISEAERSKPSKDKRQPIKYPSPDRTRYDRRYDNHSRPLSVHRDTSRYRREPSSHHRESTNNHRDSSNYRRESSNTHREYSNYHREPRRESSYYHYEPTSYRREQSRHSLQSYSSNHNSQWRHEPYYRREGASNYTSHQDKYHEDKYSNRSQYKPQAHQRYADNRHDTRSSRTSNPEWKDQKVRYPQPSRQNSDSHDSSAYRNFNNRLAADHKNNYRHREMKPMPQIDYNKPTRHIDYNKPKRDQEPKMTESSEVDTSSVTSPPVRQLTPEQVEPVSTVDIEMASEGAPETIPESNSDSSTSTSSQSCTSSETQTQTDSSICSCEPSSSESSSPIYDHRTPCYESTYGCISPSSHLSWPPNSPEIMTELPTIELPKAVEDSDVESIDEIDIMCSKLLQTVEINVQHHKFKTLRELEQKGKRKFRLDMKRMEKRARRMALLKQITLYREKGIDYSSGMHSESFLDGNCYPCVQTSNVGEDESFGQRRKLLDWPRCESRRPPPPPAGSPPLHLLQPMPNALAAFISSTPSVFNHSPFVRS